MRDSNSNVLPGRYLLIVGLLWLIAWPWAKAIGAEQVEIFIDVPPKLATYSGRQPVTFGIPFSPGRLNAGDGLRIANVQGIPLLAQFQVTSWWGPREVRWLLVDLVVPIQNGEAPQMVLEFGPDVTGSPTSTPLRVVPIGSGVLVSTGTLLARIGKQNSSLGRFVLTGVTADGDAVRYLPQGDDVQVELAGPVRAVVKWSGRYVAADGTSVAEFVTRLRFYAGLRFARLYHTLIWTSDAATRIGSLELETRSASPSLQVRTSVDGVPVTTFGSYRLRQVDWNEARDGSGQAVGQHWDGWVERKGVRRSLFAALRWPWQQHPVGFHAYGAKKLRLGLIQPIDPMSLAANDVVISPLRDYKDASFDLQANEGPYGPLSPRGVGKTHEVLIWHARRGTADYALDPAVKNTLLQRPIIAYADPRFVVQAQLPSPLSVYNPAEFPEIERAIENAFGWYTRERAEEWDYGVWNFGDLQYDWKPTNGNTPNPEDHYRKDRYWLNNGKSWSLIPWLLWMRTGNREYFDKGEAHSRHVMDVDTCHVTEVAELKFLGGTSPYSLLHFGQETRPASFTNDSEYLPYYYFLTGYERARDVMQERVTGILATYPDNQFVRDIEDMLDDLSQDYVYPSGNVASRELRFNREHYRVLGELALLYEYTKDPNLASRADELIAFLLPAQASNGWLPGLKTSNWFSHSLNLAQRAFPGHRQAIRELMLRWQEHSGTYLEPGNAGQVEGPVSLWDLLTLEDHTGNPAYLQVAAETARTQALGFYEDPNEWQGYGAPPAHVMGPIIRDWVSVMARLSQLPPADRPTGLARATYFNAGLTTDVSEPRLFKGRHVLFVLDEDDSPISVLLDVNGRNAGSIIDNRIRIIAPDGTETTTDRVIQNVPTELATLESLDLLSPFTTDAVAAYQKAITIDIPPDGQTGAYALEFYSANLETPVFARSSGGRLVHYFPAYAERAQHVAPYDLYYVYKSQMPSVSSHGYSAQVWFKPTATLLPTTFVHASRVLHEGGVALPTEPVGPNDPVYTVDNPAWPLMRAFNSDGTQSCAASITGTTADGLMNPDGLPCLFAPATEDLHSFVTQNLDWHWKIFMEGIEPFVSAIPQEWFDPRQYPSPDLQQFLVPRD